MAEVNMGGLNIKWSSLSKQDKKEYGAGIALLTIASGISGVILGGIWGERILGEINTLEWAIRGSASFSFIKFFYGVRGANNQHALMQLIC